MDYATQTHLKPLRAWLEYRLHELLTEIDADEGQLRATRAETGAVRDLKDAADDRQRAAVADAEEQRDVAELTAVRAALDRLAHGTYGDCHDCGEPIALARLTAQPAALRCAACQSAHEHAAGR